MVAFINCVMYTAAAAFSVYAAAEVAALGVTLLSAGSLAICGAGGLYSVHLALSQEIA